MLNLKEKTYIVKVVKGNLHGKNVLTLDGYSLIFRRESRENWVTLSLLIEPEVVQELRKSAKKEGVPLGDLLLRIAKDESIPLLRLPKEKGNKSRKKKEGLTIRKDIYEELKKLKGSYSLHRFMVEKLCGWYFSQAVAGNA